MGFPISVEEGSHYRYIFLFAEIFEPLEFGRMNSVLSVRVADLFFPLALKLYLVYRFHNIWRNLMCSPSHEFQKMAFCALICIKIGNMRLFPRQPIYLGCFLLQLVLIQNLFPLNYFPSQHSSQLSFLKSYGKCHFFFFFLLQM